MQRKLRPSVLASPRGARMIACNGVLVVLTLFMVAPAESAGQGTDSSYVPVGDARVNGLNIQPYVQRFKLYTIPYRPSPEDTVEEEGMEEDRVKFVRRTPRAPILRIATSHVTDGTTVDSMLVDRRSLGLLSRTTHYWNGQVVRYKARGRHVSFDNRRGPDTLEVFDSTLTEPVFAGNCEELLVLAMAPLLRSGAAFRIAVLGEDSRVHQLVVDTLDVRVTGSARYAWPASDSTDVWLVNFGSQRLWVAKDSHRILERLSGMGDAPRFEKSVAIP